MKQRFVYSPKLQRTTCRHSPNFNKNPKHVLLSQYVTKQQPNINATTSSQQPIYTKLVQNRKELPDQAMNNKKVEHMLKMQLLKQQQHKEKLGDLLRQTMNHKSSKAIYDNYAKQLNSSNQNSLAKDDILTSLKTLKGKNQRKITKSRSSTNLPESYRHTSEYQELSRKINQNKKFLEKLRKEQSQQPKQSKDYLKNVVQRSASYFDLYKQKYSNTKVKRKEDYKPLLNLKMQKATQPRLNSPSQEVKMKNKANTQNVVYSTPQNLKKKLSPVNNLPQKRPFLDEFQIGRKLGQGKFGIVNLALHIRTQGLFALKKIPKAVIKSNKMIDQLVLQLRIQSCLSHRNILSMYGFFQDKAHLYIILQYMDGGALIQKLKIGILSQKQTALVIKNITQSIEYLHELGIAHRDIKPQNVVFSNNVYKLCDFGWAAICNERRKTYCGTFDYVAPQILEGIDYDMTVDLWCLGVMTFELLTGKAPFYHISRKETMKKILNVQNSNIVYPEAISQTAKDFIDKLIRKNPLERIKANEALLHPFLINVKFD